MSGKRFLLLAAALTTGNIVYYHWIGPLLGSTGKCSNYPPFDYSFFQATALLICWNEQRKELKAATAKE